MDQGKFRRESSRVKASICVVVWGEGARGEEGDGHVWGGWDSRATENGYVFFVFVNQRSCTGYKDSKRGETMS